MRRRYFGNGKGSKIERTYMTTKRYATIKHGKVKVKLGSPQQRLLEAKDLPYSVVTIKDGKKSIKRMNVK